MGQTESKCMFILQYNKVIEASVTIEWLVYLKNALYIANIYSQLDSATYVILSSLT